jgi:gliding motility-associated lipoprotein GldD
MLTPDGLKFLPQFLIALLGASMGLFSCQKTYSPKERGYDRFDLVQPHYLPYDQGHPYTFEVSEQAIVYNDSSRLTEPHWVNIKYPSLSAEVQVTYKNLQNDPKLLHELIEDARTLINKHNIKAYGIQENVMRAGTGQNAFLFSLTGQVPTQFQFYTTDSSNHFLRGALYFRTATENDSLAPAIAYISQDMLHLLKSLRWKNVP